MPPHCNSVGRPCHAGWYAGLPHAAQQLTHCQWGRCRGRTCACLPGCPTRPVQWCLPHTQLRCALKCCHCQQGLQRSCGSRSSLLHPRAPSHGDPLTPAAHCHLHERHPEHLPLPDCLPAWRLYCCCCHLLQARHCKRAQPQLHWMHQVMPQRHSHEEGCWPVTQPLSLQVCWQPHQPMLLLPLSRAHPGMLCRAGALARCEGPAEASVRPLPAPHMILLLSRAQSQVVPAAPAAACPSAAAAPAVPPAC
jgi:hypothetical protein